MLRLGWVHVCNVQSAKKSSTYIVNQSLYITSMCIFYVSICSPRFRCILDKTRFCICYSDISTILVFTEMFNRLKDRTVMTSETKLLLNACKVVSKSSMACMRNVQNAFVIFPSKKENSKKKNTTRF